MPSGETSSTGRTPQSQWDKRVRRAGELTTHVPYAGEILAFYKPVLEFQRSVFVEVSVSRAATDSGVPFFQQIEIGKVIGFFPALLSLVKQAAPAKLAQDAQDISSGGGERQRQILADFLGARDATPHSFFARALLQPYAEHLSGSQPAPPPGSAGSVCPVCSSRPQAAVLHPEGDGGKRFLLCSFCLTEWEFRRILCPLCGEEDYQKLPRYSADAVDAVRVEACDTCHFYLKSVDMTIDGNAVPLVDEVATVPLDLWAAERGYKKAEPNLMGF